MHADGSLEAALAGCWQQRSPCCRGRSAAAAAWGWCSRGCGPAARGTAQRPGGCLQHHVHSRMAPCNSRTHWRAVVAGCWDWDLLGILTDPGVQPATPFPGTLLARGRRARLPQNWQPSGRPPSQDHHACVIRGGSLSISFSRQTQPHCTARCNASSPACAAPVGVWADAGHARGCDRSRGRLCRVGRLQQHLQPGGAAQQASRSNWRPCGRPHAACQALPGAGSSTVPRDRPRRLDQRWADPLHPRPACVRSHPRQPSECAQPPQP